MSDSEHPELDAFHELESLVREFGDELATFRRRALNAEGRARALEATIGPDAPSRERLTELEQENARLRERLEGAATRMRQMLDRVRFLRQQHAVGGGR